MRGMQLNSSNISVPNGIFGTFCASVRAITYETLRDCDPVATSVLNSHSGWSPVLLGFFTPVGYPHCPSMLLASSIPCSGWVAGAWENPLLRSCYVQACV